VFEPPRAPFAWAAHMSRVTRVAIGLGVVVVSAYAVDGAGVWLRAVYHRDPTATVAVTVTLAVPQKNGRTDFIPGGTRQQPCVRSVFSHLGLEPCWYAERHTRTTVAY
jgi:hypothetical protein